MSFTQTLLLTCIGWCAVGCTANPDAPINQRFPIRQMDRFFNQQSGSAPSAAYQADPDYTHHPGYAPAYPPYGSSPY